MSNLQTKIKGFINNLFCSHLCLPANGEGEEPNNNLMYFVLNYTVNYGKWVLCSIYLISCTYSSLDSSHFYHEQLSQLALLHNRNGTQLFTGLFTLHTWPESHWWAFIPGHKFTFSCGLDFIQTQTEPTTIVRLAYLDIWTEKPLVGLTLFFTCKETRHFAIYLSDTCVFLHFWLPLLLSLALVQTWMKSLALEW